MTDTCHQVTDYMMNCAAALSILAYMVVPLSNAVANSSPSFVSWNRETADLFFLRKSRISVTFELNILLFQHGIHSCWVAFVGTEDHTKSGRTLDDLRGVLVVWHAALLHFLFLRCLLSEARILGARLI